MAWETDDHKIRCVLKGDEFRFYKIIFHWATVTSIPNGMRYKDGTMRIPKITKDFMEMARKAIIVDNGMSENDTVIISLTRIGEVDDN